MILGGSDVWAGNDESDNQRPSDLVEKELSQKAYAPNAISTKEESVAMLDSPGQDTEGSSFHNVIISFYANKTIISYSRQNILF